MLQIENTLVSIDIVKENFKCNIKKCKGLCCVHGDSGAPLEEYELNILRDIYPLIKSYLRPEGIRTIENEGKYVIDKEKEYVTPIIDGKECAYTIFEEGIAKCAIELAFVDKKTDFRKPLSCCLYPIRIKKYNNFDAVNYDRWKICEPARVLGNRMKLPVFKFAGDALTIKYGKEWMKKLNNIASNILNSI
ncbi:MAG: DUF3109 family protein [Bacteroidales bacterium]|nr:MAG: DUF3109 family protein [Bacteroidales bacterium]